jgi:solute:Na+ symporter, SSS family
MIWISLGWNSEFMGGPGVYEIIPGFIAAWVAIMVASLSDYKSHSYLNKE